MLLLKFLKIWLFSQQDLDLAVLVPDPENNTSCTVIKQDHHVLLLNKTIMYCY